MACSSCARGFYDECGCEQQAAQSVLEVISNETVKLGRPEKSGDAIGKSAGRKRANKLFPVDKSAPCEWKHKKNCGGGKHPIVGCINGFQQHCHHGPNKNTSVNIEGNVHRICTQCHNRYHTLTDLDYDPVGSPLLPHEPEDATINELLDNEAKWLDSSYSIDLKKQILEGQNSGN